MIKKHPAVHVVPLVSTGFGGDPCWDAPAHRLEQSDAARAEGEAQVKRRSCGQLAFVTLLLGQDAFGPRASVYFSRADNSEIMTLLRIAEYFFTSSVPSHAAAPNPR